MRGALHFNQTSPISLPLPLLLAAPLFGCLALACLLAGLPDILASRWNPTLIAAVHIFTLGFLGCAMFGAVLQMLPVLTGHSPLRKRLRIRLLQAGLLLGIPLFAVGMASGQPEMLRGAAALLALAIGIFLVSLVPQYRRVRELGTRGERFAVLAGMLLALAGLLVAATLGLRLLLGWGFEFANLPRQLTDIHAGWAMLGWVAPLVFAVAMEVVPMFQYTRPLPWISRWIPPLLPAGMLLASFAVTRTIGIVLLASTLSLGAAIILLRQWRRPHGKPDATYYLFQAGMLSLLASVTVMLLPDAMLPGGDARHVIAAFLFLAGFAGSCVMGMLLKIVPFLLRIHLQRELWNYGMAALDLPAFTKMLPRYSDQWSWKLQAAGLVGALIGMTMDSTPVLIAGLVSLAAAMLICLAATWQLAWRAHRMIEEMHPQAGEGGVA